MSRRKYIVILILVLTAMLCLVGASTWIITTPSTLTPNWAKGKQPIYVSRSTEIDYTYTADGYDLDNLQKVIEFCDEQGNIISNEDNSLAYIKINEGATNGDIGNELTDKVTKITVGSTYRIDNIAININDSNYQLVGTYTKQDRSDRATDSHVVGGGNSYRLNDFILKYKTVDVGGTLFTIEDALAQNGNATLKHDTSFAGASIVSLMGYSSANYTISSDETLLLPFSDSDTEGYIHPTWEFNGDTSNLPSNTNGKKLYQTLTIPKEITLLNTGTLTVGAFTGQKGNNHIGGISGGYSKILLNGILTSTGTLNVYGDIEGSGSVNATGGTVLERMEILDWPGGTYAGARFVGNGSVPAAKLLQNGSVVEVSNPNEFPFEEYTLEAIKGPTLTIHYGTVYEGNARIFTGQIEKAGQKIPPMLSIANLKFVNVANNNTADGLIGLKNGGTATKKIENGRSQITIKGGMVGGIAALNMDLLKRSIKMDTAKVKFPISKSLDIILSGGSSSSQYGYEIMQGAKVSLTNNATLTLTNTEDGTIAYGGGGISVGSNCTLILKGKYGGIIAGEQDAVLDFQADASNSGYIGGTGSYEVDYGGAFGSLFGGDGGVDFTFTCNTTTVNAQGTLRKEDVVSQNDNFTKGTTWVFRDGAWENAKYKVNYTIEYNCLGGSIDNKETGSVTKQASAITDGEYILSVIDLPDPTRPFYRFTGWYLDEECSKLLADNPLPVHDNDHVKVYAGWEAIEYTIEFNLHNYTGSQDIPSTLTVGSTTWVYGSEEIKLDSMTNERFSEFVEQFGISLPPDTLLRLHFSGWYLDNQFSNSIGVLNNTTMQSVEINGETVTLHAYMYLPPITVKYDLEKAPNEYKSQIKYPDDGLLEDLGETIGALYPNATEYGLDYYDYDPEMQYYFDGWYIKGKDVKIDVTTTIGIEHLSTDGTIILEARWKKKFILTFQGGNVRGNNIRLGAQVERKDHTYTTGEDGWKWSIESEFPQQTIYVKPSQEVKVKAKTSNGAVNVSGKNLAQGINCAGEIDGDITRSNSEGTATFKMLSDVTVTFDPGLCFVEGTMITMADGSLKAVEDLQIGDEVLVFNHMTGQYETGTIWMMVHGDLPRELRKVINLNFSDGTTLRISYEHGLFDRTLGKYVSINEFNAQEYVGHEFSKVATADGGYIDEKVTLVSAVITEEEVKVYSPVTANHLNIVAEDMLTVTTMFTCFDAFINTFEYNEDMTVNIEQMQADIEQYGLFTYDDFKDYVSYEIWEKVPGAYLKVAIGKGLVTYEDILWLIDFLNAGNYLH